jgi:hypothetical protein
MWRSRGWEVLKGTPSKEAAATAAAAWHSTRAQQGVGATDDCTRLAVSVCDIGVSEFVLTVGDGPRECALALNAGGWF